MTPEAQRIAIAEACGWRYVPDYDPIRQGCWKDPNGQACEDECPPDYINDLNAMYEAEATMTGRQWSTYVYIMCNRDQVEDGEITTGNAALAIHAKADVRARVFLRTIGKWEA